jgi:hypothetical protein
VTESEKRGPCRVPELNRRLGSARAISVEAELQGEVLEAFMDEEAAWALERRFWLEGISAYDELLDPACLMAFPGMGVMRAAEILDSLKGAPRWQSVEMTGRSLGRAGDAVLVLGYTAEGRREDAEPYRCFCTSTYCAAGSRWKLVQHQQTLAD